jgi:hypothetical protein
MVFSSPPHYGWQLYSTHARRFILPRITLGGFTGEISLDKDASIIIWYHNVGEGGNTFRSAASAVLYFADKPHELYRRPQNANNEWKRVKNTFDYSADEIRLMDVGLMLLETCDENV